MTHYLWQQADDVAYCQRPLTKFPGGLQALHSASDDSITWLRKLSSIRIEEYLWSGSTTAPPNEAYRKQLVWYSAKGYI